jgi:cytochrome c oxidase assembly protein subunit 15
MGAMGRWTLSPAKFRAVALAAVWALLLTIFSGALVRLTGSGLGCPNWPNCTATSIIAPGHVPAWIEFGNRLINAVVTIASIGAFIAALRRVPRRRDLTLLSGGLVAGLIAEVIMGAIVVYAKLAPALVSAHFILGLAILALAVVLHHRSGLPDEATEIRRLVGPFQVWLARIMLGVLAVVVVLGTVVTSTGPHGGAPDTPRFHFSLHTVAQLHGASVETLMVLTLVVLWSLARTGAPLPVLRRAQILFAAMAAQAAVGYTQYLNGDPVALVAAHVAGASIVVVAALRFYFGLSEQKTWDTSLPPPATPVAAAVQP